MVRSFYRLGVQSKCYTKSVARSSFKFFIEQIPRELELDQLTQIPKRATLMQWQ